MFLRLFDQIGALTVSTIILMFEDDELLVGLLRWSLRM